MLKKQKNKKLKKYCVSNMKLILILNMYILFDFCQIRDHIFKTVFPKLSFFFSSRLYIFKNRCKLRRKLPNAPLRSKFQIFMKIQLRLVLQFFCFSFKIFKDTALVYFLRQIEAICFWKPQMKKKKTNLNWSYKYLHWTPVGNTAMNVNIKYPGRVKIGMQYLERYHG